MMMVIMRGGGKLYKILVGWYTNEITKYFIYHHCSQVDSTSIESWPVQNVQ